MGSLLLLYFPLQSIIMSRTITSESILKNLKIGVWNINGHSSKGYDKFGDPRFLNALTDKDIICISETHCSLENCLNLPGYHAV